MTVIDADQTPRFIASQKQRNKQRVCDLHSCKPDWVKDMTHDNRCKPVHKSL